MADPFPASKIKVARAKVHIAELDDRLTSHIIRNPPEEIIHFQEDGSLQGIHYRVNHPDPDVSAVIGDAVHNLRAALDLMAVDLVKANEGNDRKVHFPISEKEDGLCKQIKDKNFHRAGGDAVKILKSLRPFKGGNIALRGLHDLDLQDKHHTLLITNTQITTSGIHQRTVGGVSKFFLEGESGTFLDFTFPEGSPFANQPIVPTLHGLVKLVEDILETFAILLSGKADS